MATDNWQHRSAGMVCGTCVYFVPKRPFDTSISVGATITASVNVLATPVLGRCRRHAPTMNGYPGVFANDWCGDHKLDENKLGPAGGA